MVLGLSSDHARIVILLVEEIRRFSADILNSEFRGMRSVAPRIVNDISYVTRITHEIHFAWQAQYLVKLEDDSCCSAQCKYNGSYVSRIKLCSTGAVQSSAGVDLCRTELYFVVQTSTGV